MYGRWTTCVFLLWDRVIFNPHFHRPRTTREAVALRNGQWSTLPTAGFDVPALNLSDITDPVAVTVRETAPLHAVVYYYSCRGAHVELTSILSVSPVEVSLTEPLRLRTQSTRDRHRQLPFSPLRSRHQGPSVEAEFSVVPSVSTTPSGHSLSVLPSPRMSIRMYMWVSQDTSGNCRVPATPGAPSPYFPPLTVDLERWKFTLIDSQPQAVNLLIPHRSRL